MTGDIKAGMEDPEITVLVLINFSNTFNTISHDILLSCGLTGMVLILSSGKPTFMSIDHVQVGVILTLVFLKAIFFVFCLD